MYANDDCVHFYTEALRLSQDVNPGRLRQAQLEQGLAQAFHDLGNMPTALQHYEKGLRYLNAYNPTSSYSFKLRVFRKILRLGLKKVFPKGMTGCCLLFRGSDEEELRVMALRADLSSKIAQIHFLRHHPYEAVAYAIFAVNDVVDESSSAYVMANANMTMVAHFGYHSLANRFCQRAIELATELNMEAAYVCVQSGNLYIRSGKWALAEDAFDSGKLLAEGTRNKRLWEHCLYMLAFISMLQGKFAHSVACIEECYASASARGDKQRQVWLMNLRTIIHLVQGEREVAAEIQSDRGASGLQALVFLCTDRAKRALDILATVVPKLDTTHPTLNEDFMEFVPATEVCMILLSSQSMQRHRAAIKTMARTLLACMRRFAKAFPLAEPRYALFKGQYLNACQQYRAATASWQHCIDRAHRLSMPFDEALGTFALRPNCMLVLVHIRTRLCRFHMRPEWVFGDVSAGERSRVVLQAFTSLGATSGKAICKRSTFAARVKSSSDWERVIMRSMLRD